MKKYPVTYKNELYEVRWETIGWIPRITIYKVTTSKLLKLKVYKEVCSEYESIIDKRTHFPESDPNYYIEQVKTIFELWEQDIEIKTKSKIIEQNKQQALSEWDGVIG